MMIDPQVEQGGASSWFCIAANDAVAFDAIAAVGDAPAAAAAGTSSGSCSGVVTRSSATFTPARNCASCERNFDAIQRKM
jgi:hypothetical protein